MNWTSEEIDWIDTLSRETVSPATVLKLRTQFGPDRASQILSLAALQPRARRKFGDGLWMVTEKSVEQASDRAVAKYKTTLITTPLVTDLCCGVGGDAMEFGRRHDVIAVDADANVTKMLQWNLQQAGVSSIVAVCDDAITYADRLRGDWPKLFFHIDPDRRPVTGERVAAPEMYLPALERIQPLWSKTAGCLVKVAPAAHLPSIYAQQIHRQWISLDGSVREQMLMSESVASTRHLRTGSRSAVRVHRDGFVDTYQPEHDDACGADTVDSPQLFVFDLDPAVRAAGLSEVFAREQAWQTLGTASGFFTSSHWSGGSKLLQAFRTVWIGPADRKLIKRELLRLERRVQTIKVRGTDHDPAQFRKQVAVEGQANSPPLTLLIGRTNAGVYAVLADQVPALLSA